MKQLEIGRSAGTQAQPCAPGIFSDERPEDYQLRVKSGSSQNPSSLKVPFSKSEENGRIVYRWQHTNLSHQSDNENSKKENGAAPKQSTRTLN